jgi:ribosomal protein S26
MQEKVISEEYIKQKSKKNVQYFYSCAVHYGIYILYTHQQMHFLLNLEKFKFT